MAKVETVTLALDEVTRVFDLWNDRAAKDLEAWNKFAEDGEHLAERQAEYFFKTAKEIIDG